MKIGFVNIEHRHRLAEGGPNAVIIDPGGHHHHQHLVRINFRGGDDFIAHR
jgi:hypothetical protein